MYGWNASLPDYSFYWCRYTTGEFEGRFVYSNDPPLERVLPEIPASNGGAVSFISICDAVDRLATG
jgi:hypothetical protein